MSYCAPRRTAIAAALLFSFGGAHAATELDEIVVSASRSEQTTFDAPGSIQSVNRAQVEAAGPQINISEALVAIPGINVANRNNFSQDLQISIRGFGSRAPFGVRGVRLIIDGIPQTLPDGQGQSSQFALTSAERIEVLKGPISMLYGNAAGGVVQVFTRSPSEKPEFSFNVYSGSDELFRTSTQYSEKRGAYGLIVDYATFRSDGFREYSNAKRDHLNAKLEHYGQKSKTTFIANILKNKTEEPGSLTFEQYRDTPRIAQLSNKTERFGKEFTQGVVGITGERIQSASATYGYRAYYGTRKLDNPLGCRQFPNNTICPNTGATNTTGFSIIDRSFYGLGLNVKSNTSLNETPVEFIVGFDGDYVLDKRTARQNVAGVPTGSLGRNEENVAYNADFYIQSQWFFNEHYTGLLGARRTRVTLKVDDNFLGNGDASGSRAYNGVSPVVGLTRHISPELNIFAQIGRGFETPTLTEVLYSPPGGSAANSFNGLTNPARSQQLEVGFKWRPDSTLKIDGSLFQAKTKDDLVPDKIDTVGSTWQNAKTLRQGFELSGLKLITGTLALRAAYTHIDAEYRSSGTGENSITPGNDLPGIPKRKFFAELAWRSAGWLVKANQTFSEMGFEVNAVGEMYANSTNTVRIGSYEIYSLRAAHHIKHGSHTLSFFGRLENLTGKKYVGSVIVDQSSSRFYEPGAPRNWLIGAKYTANF